MTPRPYRNRTYSHVPNQDEAAMTGMYTIHGGGSCLKAKKNPKIPMMAETTWTSAIMTGEHNG